MVLKGMVVFGYVCFIFEVLIKGFIYCSRLVCVLVKVFMRVSVIRMRMFCIM